MAQDSQNISVAEKAKILDSAWKPLYRVGGASALLMLVLIPIQMIVFFVWPPPSTIIAWFALFHENA